MSKALIGVCVILCALAACTDPITGDEVAVARSGGVEIIGISGRRLTDGDRYRLPLDSTRTIACGASVREAMVILNRGLGPARLERIELTPEAGSTARWRLLAPTRARELRLEPTDVPLPAEGRLDFDIGVAPVVEGLQRAWLVIAWREGARQERVEIMLEARAIGANASTGPDPP